MARIIQIVPVFVAGDAVGNEAMALHAMLRKCGFESEIWARFSSFENSATIIKPQQVLSLNANDVAILHFSTCSDVNTLFAQAPCKKIMIYHNVTPGDMVREFNPIMAGICDLGRQQLAELSHKIDFAIAVSEYNKKELLDLHFSCPVEVVPIYIDFEDYQKKPNMKCVRAVVNKLGPIFLFTGRIVPNKCQEDVIAAFGFYRKHYNSNAHLFLVGNCKGNEGYVDFLKKYVEAHHIEGVNITGSVPFRDILAFYTAADAMVCMSEHEGFCVPLVEAMMFDVPIIAYNSSAIAETLGGSGIVLNKKDPAYVASVMNEVVTNQQLRQRTIGGQRRRLKDFDAKLTMDKMLKCIMSCMDKYSVRED